MSSEDLLKELVQRVYQLVELKLREHTTREVKVSRDGTAEEIKEMVKQTVDELYRQVAIPSHMLNGYK